MFFCFGLSVAPLCVHWSKSQVRKIIPQQGCWVFSHSHSLDPFSSRKQLLLMGLCHWLPWSQPQIWGIGLSEKELRASGIQAADRCNMLLVWWHSGDMDLQYSPLGHWQASASVFTEDTVRFEWLGIIYCVTAGFADCTKLMHKLSNALDGHFSACVINCQLDCFNIA